MGGLQLRNQRGRSIEVDLNGNEVLVDVICRLGVAAGVAVHEFARWTPHRSHINKNGTVQLLSALESLPFPGIPIDRLQNGTLQVCRLLSIKVVGNSLRTTSSCHGDQTKQQKRNTPTHASQIQSSQISYKVRE